MRFPILTAFVLAILPMSTHAADVLSFDFRNGLPDGWQVQGWTGAAVTDQGLDVRTASDGGIFGEIDGTYAKQVIKISTISPKRTDALVLWDGTNDTMEQLPFVVPQSSEPKVTTILLSMEQNWASKTKSIGLALPAGATVIVQDITLLSYGPLERLGWMVKSFFHIDTLQTFSINFLWGPLLGFSPEQIDVLYRGQPPRSWSAMRAIYLLLIGGLAIAVLYAVRRRKTRAWTIAIATFASLWILLDLRMSAELLSYAAQDWKTYLSKPVETRVLRDRREYYSVMEQVTPWLQEVSQYGFISDWPVTGSVRYFTYPSLPVAWDASGIVPPKRWFIFEASNISVVDGRLARNELSFTAPGEIVRTFGSGSFLFQVP